MLNFRPSKLTDDEFIERIRRQAPINRKVAAGMSAVYIVILAGLLYQAPTYFYSFRNLAPDATAYEQGFSFGIFLGATVGGAAIVLIWHIVHSLMIAFVPQAFRSHRLLLKYYDLAPKPSAEAGTNLS